MDKHFSKEGKKENPLDSQRRRMVASSKNPGDSVRPKQNNS
jgi:hypothetical protein